MEQNTELKLILKSLGYRPNPLDKNLWLKPAGYNILKVELNELRISSWFFGADSKLHCWSSQRIVPENINSRYISGLEKGIIHLSYIFPPKDLGFITQTEKIEIIMEL